MEHVERKKKKLPASLKGFPHSHLFAIVGLSLTLAVSMAFSNKAESTARYSAPLAIPAIHDTAPVSTPSDTAAPAELEVAPAPELKKLNETVHPGDSLSAIFKRAGLSDRQMMELLSSGDDSKRLASIMPGHQLQFEIGDGQQLEKLTYIEDRLNNYAFSRDGDSYRYSEQHRQPEVHWASRSGTIEQSLYAAGLQAGLDDKLIMGLAEIFGWDVDFALDIRKGDSFKIVYEEEFIDGELLGHGSILSAEFTNQGKTFRAVRYVDEDGRVQYFTPDGKNMRKAFLRAPLDFRRISDGFNPHRLHPITGKIRPHRGIDYAARTGTPVWASGDGKVLVSGYTRFNGNYIVIQHGNNIQTKYLHLSKRYVKTGQHVRQKQVIGAVGMTGLATGPHLHYEFLLNGVHRNPRTIVEKLPKAESIPHSEMARFLQQTEVLVAALNGVGADSHLATLEQEHQHSTL